ncbi:nuclear transport factor 2 family protein [Herbidospora sp. RD11066]
MDVELRALEPIFHRVPAGAGRAVFEALTADDFFEVGASGRLYPREYVLDTLAERHSRPHDDPWEIADFAARRLDGDTWLVTYLLDQAGRLSRRSTIWTRTDAGWIARYHQGTLA